MLFFCRRFLFQIKRKCRNAGSIKSLIIVGREGRVQILQFYIMPLARHRCVESPHPTKWSINLYRLHGWRYPLISRTFSLFTFTYYFERSETNPSVLASPIQLPYRGAEKQANEVRPYGRQDKYLQRFRVARAASVRRGRRTLQAAILHTKPDLSPSQLLRNKIGSLRRTGLNRAFR